MPMAGARDQEGRALDCRSAAKYSHVRVRVQVAVHVLSLFRQAFSQTGLPPNPHSILCQRTVLTIRFIFRRALHHSCIQHDRCSSRIPLAKPPTLHIREWGSHQGKEGTSCTWPYDIGMLCMANNIFLDFLAGLAACRIQSFPKYV
jgi:hypothetical protein